MKYSEAVKSQVTASAKHHAIKSSWETEFGRTITDADWANLQKFFSINETYSNFQKVTCFKNRPAIKFIFLYGFGVLKFQTYLSQHPSLICSFSPKQIPRDGDCLFHGMYYVLFKISSNHSYLSSG